MTGHTSLWRGRHRFVLLSTGGVSRFLPAWQAWRADAERCSHLDVIVIANGLESVAAVSAVSAVPAVPAVPAHELAAELRAAWPPMTPGLHRLSFEGGRVNLLLALGDLQAWLPELVARVDAFDLDDFPQAGRIAKALGRLAAVDASLVVRSANPALRSALTAAGFALQPMPGDHDEPLLTHARYAPRFTPTRTAARRPSAPGARRTVIVGGGLAGCAAAWALAEQGWHSQVIERGPRVAGEASGNPAGLFHGIVHAQDGAHARFNRAAALMAREAVQTAIDVDHAAGGTRGLLRLETALTPTEMQAVLTRLGLPAGYVQPLTAQRASEHCGLALRQSAWFYPGGGWVEPAALAASYLRRAGAHADLRCNTAVHRLQRIGSGWQLQSDDGMAIAEADVVVLANAGDAFRLLDHPPWPIERLRGQISVLPNAVAGHGLALPRLPIAGAGYLLPAVAGAAVFGSTSQANDGDPAVRLEDHLINLAQLSRLTGQDAALPASALSGRTAWRWSAVDRLPLIGAVPDIAAARGARLDQARFVPRLPGLHVFTALGSRGITWSALGAQVLAAEVSGAPQVLEASLLAAIDPARFISRAARRGAADTR